MLHLPRRKKIVNYGIADSVISDDNLLRLAKGMTSGIDICKVDNKLCEICIKGKQSRLPFKHTGNRAKEVLELIHSDLCGSIKTAFVRGAR